MFYSTLLSVEVKRTRRLFRVRCSLFVWQRVGVFIADDVIEGIVLKPSSLNNGSELLAWGCCCVIVSWLLVKVFTNDILCLAMFRSLVFY